MTHYATFNDAGFPTGFYSDAAGDHGPRLINDLPNPDCKIPVEAVELTEHQWQEFIANQGLRRWNAATGRVNKYDPPTPDPEAQPYRIYKAQMIDRMTDAEAETFDGLLAAAPTKMRLRINASDYFVSNDPGFPQLLGALAQAFGQERAGELLARP